MEDKIRITDKERGTVSVYELSHHESTEEQEEETSLFYIVVKSIFKFFKFSLYLVLTFIKMLIRVIETIFNLTEYEPFKPVTDSYKNKMDKKTLDYIVKNKKSTTTISHKYEFIRSRKFTQNYLIIDELLTNCYKNGAILSEKVYSDIMSRIKVLLVECEKQSFAESYKYAKESHYIFESQEAFDRYVKDRILKGEDYSENNQQLLEELRESHNKKVSKR